MPLGLNSLENENKLPLPNSHHATPAPHPKEPNEGMRETQAEVELKGLLSILYLTGTSPPFLTHLMLRGVPLTALGGCQTDVKRSPMSFTSFF